MRIRAVGIYEDSNRGYQVRFADDDDQYLNRFRRSILLRFLKTAGVTTGNVDEKYYNNTVHVINKFDDHHYYFQLNSATKHVLVVVSENKLNHIEANMLLANINFVDQESMKLGKDGDVNTGCTEQDMQKAYVEPKLLEIKTNPVGYNSRGTRFNTYKIDKVREEMVKVKDQMKKNIELVLERGEKIEELVQQSALLAESSRQFRRGAEDLRDSMTCCGGVRTSIRHAGQKLRIID